MDGSQECSSSSPRNAQERQTLLGRGREGGSEREEWASAKRMTRLILRLEHLINYLFPVAIGEDEITSPTSWVITASVLDTFEKVAQEDEGGFVVVPYALLCARARFIRRAKANPADYEEEMLRRTACSVLATRLLARFDDHERDTKVLTKRWRHCSHKGELSMSENAIELAIDSRDTLFLSSNRVQNCVNAIWRGELIQYTSRSEERLFRRFENVDKPGIYRHFDCLRVSVPRYQNLISISMSVIWLIVYSLAIADPDRSIDFIDFVTYLFLLGTIVDFVTEYAKVGLRTIDVWQVFNLIMMLLYTTSFIVRMQSFATSDVDQAKELGKTSYRLLASLAPLMWIRLLVVLDNFSIFGSLEVVLTAMLREATVFFGLLAVLLLGFLSSYLGLAAAEDVDGDNGSSATGEAIRMMLKGLLQSPDFDASRDFSIFGEVLYHIYVALIALILLNILISVFNTSYSDIVEESMNHYLSMFATKVVGILRAPDEFPFIPPLNLLEGILLIPLSFFLSRERYDRLSRITMTVVYFLPLCFIAIFEGRFVAVRKRKECEEARLEADERRQARSNLNGRSTASAEDEDEDEDELADELLHRNDLEREILREGGAPSARLCRQLRSALKPADATQGEKIHEEVTQLRQQLEEIKALLIAGNRSQSQGL